MNVGCSKAPMLRFRTRTCSCWRFGHRCTTRQTKYTAVADKLCLGVSPGAKPIEQISSRKAAVSGAKLGCFRALRSCGTFAGLTKA
jgi:hypothetical protein